MRVPAVLFLLRVSAVLFLALTCCSPCEGSNPELIGPLSQVLDVRSREARQKLTDFNFKFHLATLANGDITSGDELDSIETLGELGAEFKPEFLSILGRAKERLEVIMKSAKYSAGKSVQATDSKVHVELVDNVDAAFSSLVAFQKYLGK